MTESELKLLKDENERLNSEIERLTKEGERLKSALRSEELVDLWGHQAYRIGLLRLTRFGVVILTIVGVLGAGFFFDIYQKVNGYVDGKARTIIDNQIETMSSVVSKRAEEFATAIDTNLEMTKTEVDRKIKELMTNATQKANNAIEKVNQNIADMDRNITKADDKVGHSLDEINDQVALAKDVLKKVQSNAERARQLALAQVTSDGVKGTGGSEKGACASNNRRIELIGVDQVVVDSGEKNQNDRALFKNTFSVSVASGQETEEQVRKCTLSRIDRVVYKLNDYWFSPSEIVRVDPSEGFAFWIRVWGSTRIQIQVYLKDIDDPIEFQGNLHANPGGKALNRKS